MNLIEDLQARLETRAEPSRKAWWESYLKGTIGFRGVDMEGIRSSVRAWYADHAIERLPAQEQKSLAWRLMRADLTEDKLAGILILQEILVPAGLLRWTQDLAVIADLFDSGHIYDWNTCDWLCVRVLGPLAEREGEPCARSIAAWATAENLWRRRAAGIAFVNLARRDEELFPDFRAMLLEICEATVRSSERFAQTGTAWVLRELSRAEPALVIDFVERHVGLMSREAVRSATDKLEAAERGRLLHAHEGLG